MSVDPEISDGVAGRGGATGRGSKRARPESDVESNARVESVVPGALVRSVRVRVPASARALDAPSSQMSAMAKLTAQRIRAKKGKERQTKRVAKPHATHDARAAASRDLNASDQSGLWEPSSLEDYCDPDYIPSVDAHAVAAADTSDSLPPLSTADPIDSPAKAAATATETNLGARGKSGRGGGRGGRSGRGRPRRAPARERLAGRTNSAQSCPDTGSDSDQDIPLNQRKSFLRIAARGDSRGRGTAADGDDLLPSGGQGGRGMTGGGAGSVSRVLRRVRSMGRGRSVSASVTTSQVKMTESAASAPAGATASDDSDDAPLFPSSPSAAGAGIRTAASAGGAAIVADSDTVPGVQEAPSGGTGVARASVGPEPARPISAMLNENVWGIKFCFDAFRNVTPLPSSVNFSTQYYHVTRRMPKDVQYPQDSSIKFHVKHESARMHYLAYTEETGVTLFGVTVIRKPVGRDFSRTLRGYQIFTTQQALNYTDRESDTINAGAATSIGARTLRFVLSEDQARQRTTYHATDTQIWMDVRCIVGVVRWQTESERAGSGSHNERAQLFKDCPKRADCITMGAPFWLPEVAPATEDPASAEST